MFYNPLSKEKPKHVASEIDYEFANKELAEAKGFGTQAGMSKGKFVTKLVIMKLATVAIYGGYFVTVRKLNICQ